MPLTHSVSLSDGNAEVTLSWSPDGSTVTVVCGDETPVSIDLGRDSIFAISQWAGTVLNQMHFGDEDGPE